jgi:predicted DNA-binding antitoxin AbrB/MazE fold protein
MHAINAIYEGTVFKPMQPVPVKEDYEVVITFIKPVKKEKAKSPRANIIGRLKGKIKMAEDFDAPLEEMKEYMP